MRSLRRTLPVVAVVWLSLAACGNDSPDPPTPPPADSTTTPGVAPGHDLADGEHFAWVGGSPDEGLILDPAEMLTGEEARQAAVSEGVISEGEDLPNDFYITDPDDDTHAVPVAADAEYSVLLFADGAPTETAVSADEFASALSGSHPDVYGVVEGEMPANLTIEGGVITSVAQVYLP